MTVHLALDREQARERADAAQRRAADPARSVWVAASAGSGKTKVLSDRVLSLLLYAESCDVAVPATAITAVHDTLHGGAIA